MEINNLSDAEFNTLGIRMFKELTGYFNIIKKSQVEMKVTVSETKTNLRGTNSGVDGTKSQINDLEHKEEINSIKIAKRKKNPHGPQNKEDRVSSV